MISALTERAAPLSCSLNRAYEEREKEVCAQRERDLALVQQYRRVSENK